MLCVSSKLSVLLHFTTHIHPTSTDWVTFIHGAGGSSTIWYKQLREFSVHYNVLLVDLRGHGESKTSDAFNQKYTFDSVTQDVVEVLEHLKISSSHFVGISLGTIIIRQIADYRPDLVNSMILGGAILKLNLRSQFLMKFGNAVKSFIPYLWLYQLFAFIIMPKRNHKESRNLFVREAKKIYQREFKRWYKLTSEINSLLRVFRTEEIAIPTLYIMGEEDHMFLPSIKKVVRSHSYAALEVVNDCGHVVNVERPKLFNKLSIRFLKQFST